jgi:hypothetical protein
MVFVERSPFLKRYKVPESSTHKGYWVFQTGCFAPGSTVLLATIGALRALSFKADGGKIQATRYAGGR